MKKNIKKKLFVGRPFPDAMMDEQKSFTEVNQQMENDEVFQKFLADNNLENKRTVGLMKFELPKAEVAEIEQENQNLVFFNLPLNGTMPEFIHKIVSEGIEVYQNIGDSETPYVTWDLDMDTKKLTQDLYLKVSE